MYYITKILIMKYYLLRFQVEISKRQTKEEKERIEKERKRLKKLKKKEQRELAKKDKVRFYYVKINLKFWLDLEVVKGYSLILVSTF